MHHLPGGGPWRRGRHRPTSWSETRLAREGELAPEHPSLLPDPGQFGPLGCRDQPGFGPGDRPGSATPRLITSRHPCRRPGNPRHARAMPERALPVPHGRLAGQAVTLPRLINVLLRRRDVGLGDDHPAGSGDVADDVDRIVDGTTDHEAHSRVRRSVRPGCRRRPGRKSDVRRCSRYYSGRGSGRCSPCRSPWGAGGPR